MVCATVDCCHYYFFNDDFIINMDSCKYPTYFFLTLLTSCFFEAGDNVAYAGLQLAR